MKRELTLALVSLIACSGVAVYAENETSKLQLAQNVAPDNTKKNIRDRNQARLTAEDQSNAGADLDITSNLRKAIIRTKGLSANAQNVKIITKNGRVTLRGPVNTLNEKNLIGDLAQRICAGKAISNQLEVKR